MRSRLRETWFHLRRALKAAAQPPAKVARDRDNIAADSIPEVARALAFRGIFARIASQEGLSLSHVFLVAQGKRTSKRVLSAIVDEVRRIEQIGGGGE